jgi:tetratricopeptide (TPR) repeat protein
MLIETRRKLKRKRTSCLLIGIGISIVLAIGIYFLPPVHSRLAWRLEALTNQIKFFFNPPEDVVFVPGQQTTGTPLPAATGTPTLTPLPDLPTAAPTLTPTPLPPSIKLTGITYSSQCNRWNYCGAANLSMALNYWGWSGDRDKVAEGVKPGENDPNKDFISRGEADVNIMPYEMVDFANAQAGFRAIYRYGGDVELLKRMVAAGFPVLIEKGYYQRDTSGRISWMGHYSFVTGYDDAQGVFIWQDSFPDACDDRDNPAVVEQKGRDNLIAYDDVLTAWRGFDYVFIVVYPADREAEVMQTLGPWADWNWAAQHALETARAETTTMTGADQFFAWFNLGTSHVALQQYGDAAYAYDQAYTIYYPGLPNEDPENPKKILRPYRITWYQTGPFWAYYYTSRYQDVITLATTNLDTITPPKTLEESFYWRALAEYKLGQYDAAYADMRKAVYYNKNFQAAVAVMQEWGISP